MLIVWVFVYKKLAQFAVRCALPPRRSESPVCATDNKPSACCICWAGLLGRAVFPPWNEGPNFGSYILDSIYEWYHTVLAFLCLRKSYLKTLSFLKINILRKTEMLSHQRGKDQKTFPISLYKLMRNSIISFPLKGSLHLCFWILPFFPLKERLFLWRETFSSQEPFWYGGINISSYNYKCLLRQKLFFSLLLT